MKFKQIHEMELKKHEMERVETPPAGCKAKPEDLLRSKRKLDTTDDCPNCEKLGFLCFVSNHPSRPVEQVTELETLFKIFSLNVVKELADIKSSVKVVSNKLTPSENCRSSPECVAPYNALLETLRLILPSRPNRNRQRGRGDGELLQRFYFYLGKKYSRRVEFVCPMC